MSAPSIANPTNLQTIPWKNLQVGKLLGEGAYGEVYLGNWNGKEVAIKKLILKKLPAYLAKDFEREAKIMAECGQSPHIIKLFGICTEEGQYSMVMEYMQKNSLNEVLSDQDIELSWELRFRIALAIGKGLSFLHEREILHRDLKSHNVLLDSEFNAKITDFGLSKLKLESSSKSKQDNPSKKSVGTLRWQAPELFKLSPVHTKATDVYAYGMVLWEIAARQLPYGTAEDSVIINCVKEGEREPIPEDCPPTYGELIQHSWTKEPEKRPGSHYLVLQLEKLLPAAAKLSEAESSTSAALKREAEFLESFCDDMQEARREIQNRTKRLEGLSLVRDRSILDKIDALSKSVEPSQSSKSPSDPPISSHLKAVLPIKPSASAIPAIAFGKAAWEKYFGDIGIEPPLPPDIEQILNAPCPFWPGEKVRETHLLTLIPQTVNGQPLTLKNLGELVKAPKQGHSTKYNTFYLGEYTDHPVRGAHWALLTRDVIPGSRYKSYADQQALVASHAQKTRIPYQVPTIIDAAVSIFMEHVQSGVRLYGDSPRTNTRCQEKYAAKWQLAVGFFAPSGLFVHVRYFCNDEVGGVGSCGSFRNLVLGSLVLGKKELGFFGPWKPAKLYNRF